MLYFGLAGSPRKNCKPEPTPCEATGTVDFNGLADLTSKVIETCDAHLSKGKSSKGRIQDFRSMCSDLHEILLCLQRLVEYCDTDLQLFPKVILVIALTYPIILKRWQQTLTPRKRELLLRHVGIQAVKWRVSEEEIGKGASMLENYIKTFLHAYFYNYV